MTSMIPKNLILPFSILVLTFLLTSCHSPKAPEYRTFKNFTIEKSGFASTTLKMDLVYFNPNDFGLDLASTDLDIFIDSNYLGKTIQENSVAISRRAEFSIPIIINIDMNNFLKNSFVTLFNKEVTIKIIGSIKVGKLNVFKTFPVIYEGKQHFSLF